MSAPHDPSPPDPAPRESGLREGRVTAKSRGYYFVLTEEGKFLCRISNRLRKQLVFPTAAASSARQGVAAVGEIGLLDPVAVGDRVRLVDGGGGTGSIKEVLPRRNKFSRMTHRGRPMEQVIAANVDQVVGVFAAARPDLRRDMLDRMCIESEILGAPLAIVITKMDLADAEEIDELERLYAGLGYPVLKTCPLSGEGIDALRASLAGKQSVLVGESGVGKTTLLNVIEPGWDLAVGDVRKGKRGRGSHTTTMVQAIAVAGGGWIIDTPGINDLGLFLPDGAARDPAWFFRELRPLIEHCRFGDDCRHIEEPGCAVLAALEAGTIDEGRYESYLELREELLDPKGSGR